MLGLPTREDLDALGEDIAALGQAQQQTSARAEGVLAAIQAQSEGLGEHGAKLGDLAVVAQLQGRQLDCIFTELSAQAGRADAIAAQLGAIAIQAGRIEHLEAKLTELTTLMRHSLRLLKSAPGLRASAAEPGVALVRLANGQKLYVDTRDTGAGAELLVSGELAPERLAAVRKLVREGATCIDVGAHCGFFTVLMAHLARPTRASDRIRAQQRSL